MEVTWSRNRATMCFLRPFLLPDPHITITCINNFYINIPHIVNIPISSPFYAQTSMLTLGNYIYVSRASFMNHLTYTYIGTHIHSYKLLSKLC